MGTKKSAFWVWLKPYASKALEDMKAEYGEETVRKLCGKWVRVDAPNAGGGFACEELDWDCILRAEIAKAVESDTCPNVQWGPAPKIPRPMVSKTKAAKHVWTKIPHPEITIRTTKRKILERLGEILDKANDLGTENAKLKNQIASLKKKGSK